MRRVPFIVEGLNDRGEPSGLFLEVVEVAILDADGAEVGRFKTLQEFREAFGHLQSFWKVRAITVTGEPTNDLTGDVVCDE